jgi:hypothetical protein
MRSPNIPTVSIHALFAADSINPNPELDPRPALAAVEVILGVDVMTGREFLVYGRDALERIVRSRRPTPMRMLKVELDQETNELERLLALVRLTKGHDDYRSRSRR